MDQPVFRSDHQRPIKVLHIIDSLPIGGAENQVVTLAPALGSDCYAVHVCCLRREGVQANTLRARGIPVVSLNMRLRYWPLAMYRLYRLIKQIRPKIVHAHLYESGIWGRLMGKLAGVPVLMTTEHCVKFPKRRYLLLEILVNRFTQKMIAVSEEIRQIKIKDQGIPPQKVITIPNAVNIERFTALKTRDPVRMQLGIDGSSPLIGTVGRLVPEKRIDYLLEAADIVVGKVPNARFLIIGDGPLRQELENQARHLNQASECVQFLGSRHDVPALLSALDIFVLSSESEGLPVALLEAMAASKPIVATRVGGIPQVIEDRVDGLLISPHDPKGLAEAIFTLINDSDISESLAREAYRTVEESYSTKTVCRKIIELYDHSLGNL